VLAVRARLLAAVVAATLLTAAATAEARRVHLRGTAYEFNNTSVRLAGATVRVAELPGLRARTRADGTYDLAVPDRSRVTPYINAPGYGPIHLQTFRTDGEDLARVNFQTPTEAVYAALAALLDVPLDAQGRIQECAIVSTFSTRNVRDLGFDAFTGYGAHGVAGATAFATPALPAAIYFNESVIPDPAQRRSSVDGGVIWTRVPAGTYRIRARHPSRRFASFLATCAPGRVVNANPPWGLHELGRPARVTASAGWSVSGSRTTLARLRLRKLPEDAVVRVRCGGAACALRRRVTLRPRGTRVDLRAALPPAARTLAAGQRLEVLVTAHAHDGRLFRWRIRDGAAPRAATLCVPLGQAKPRRRC
jgi:hypothetical protein